MNSPSSIQIPGLSHADQNTLDKLVQKLDQKQWRNRVRVTYYDSKYALRDLGISLPPELRKVESVLGWPAKSVDVLSKRVNLEGFVVPGGSAADFGIDQIWQGNNLQVDAPQAHTSALIHSVSFLAVTSGDVQSDEPEVLISPADAMSSTGIWDPRRRRLSSALRLVEVNDTGQPSYLVMYLPDRVLQISRTNGGPWKIDARPHNLGRVPVEPLVYHPRLGRPFGSSRISRAVMSITDAALRTLLRSEAAAEFFSIPQRWIMGADEQMFKNADGTTRGQWETIAGRVFAAPLAEKQNGEEILPTVGQFPQMSMQPHMDQLRSLAELFAGETSLPLASLGIVQDNPSSAEAIFAAKEELIIEAEAAMDTFGAGWSNALRTAIRLRDGSTPAELQSLQPKWRDPSTPSRAAAADAVSKLVGAGILPVDSDVTLELLGMDQTMIERLRAERQRANASDALRALAELGAGPEEAADGDDSEDSPA